MNRSLPVESASEIYFDNIHEDAGNQGVITKIILSVTSLTLAV